MQRLIIISDGLERFIIRIGRIAKWLFLPLIAVILFDVIARKIPGASYFIMQSWLVDYVSSTRLQELEWHLHAALLGLVLAYTYIYNGHIRIDLFREKTSNRTKLWIEFIGTSVVLTPYVLLLLYFGWPFIATSFAAGEGSYAMSGLPHRWIVKGVVYSGFILLLLAGIAKWLRVVAALAAGRDAEFDPTIFPAAGHNASAIGPEREV